MLEALGLQTSFLWAPYDPNHSISMRRLKYKLSAYDHHSIPHIEKYANQDKWRRGTLEEPMSQEELNKRALRNLRKMADLELCSQVFTLPSTQTGAAESSSTAKQQTTKATENISSKGKEKEMETEQPHQEKKQSPPVTQEQTDKER